MENLVTIGCLENFSVCPEKKSICCIKCDKFTNCSDACDDTPDKCEASYEKSENKNEIENFEKGNLATINKISEIVNKKKELEKLEKELKAKLQEAMEVNGIKKFESDILNITYVAATTATSIDSTKLKKKYPKIAEECSKTSNKKAYVKVVVK